MPTLIHWRHVLRRLKMVYFHQTFWHRSFCKKCFQKGPKCKNCTIPGYTPYAIVNQSCQSLARSAHFQVPAHGTGISLHLYVLPTRVLDTTVLHLCSSAVLSSSLGQWPFRCSDLARVTATASVRQLCMHQDRACAGPPAGRVSASYKGKGAKLTLLHLSAGTS